MEKGLVFTGARARFSINGKKVGYATNVSGQEEIEYQPVETLDNIEVEEFVPVRYRTNFSASRVRLVGITPKQEGFFPKVGTSPEEHLKNILAQGDVVATIEDSKSGKILMTYEQVKMSTRNWAIAAGGIVAEDQTFVCVRAKDESEIV